MNQADFVAALTAANPELFRQLPEARVRRMVAAVLRQIGSQVDATAEGETRVPGLGRFIVRNAPDAKSGATQRRVIFRRAQPAAAKA